MRSPASPAFGLQARIAPDFQVFDRYSINSSASKNSGAVVKGVDKRRSLAPRDPPPFSPAILGRSAAPRRANPRLAVNLESDDLAQ